MKKGFTMIELIFVIVILGILASVAIPRLAATRTDAEISATVANIRTLISDAAAYYAVKGSFTDAKWSDVTNVPVRQGDKRPASDSKVTELPDGGAAYLTTGDKNCILVRLRNSTNTTPAFIQIAKVVQNVNDPICRDILAAAPIKAYLDLTVPGVLGEDNTNIRPGTIALGSNLTIHQ